MKTTTWILTSLLAATLFILGCSKSDAPGQVDATPVQKSFASAEPSVKATAEKAVEHVKAGNYQSALTELQQLAGNAKLTDEQKKAVSDVLAKVQQAIADTLKKATGEANKALEGVQKTFGK